MCVGLTSHSTIAETASTTVSKPVGASAGQSSVADFERHVREIAERTAAEEKARKEQAKAAKANTSNTSGDAFKIFKYRKDGAVVFADSAPYKTRYDVIVYNSCYACSITSKVDWHNTRLHLTEFGDYIAQASQEHNVDPALIRAVIHAESAFNPLARSKKGATGLMQLMPGTAKDMGVKDASVPAQNIQGGVKYLAYLLQTFSGNQTLAAAAYNAGPNAVTRHGGVPPYQETETYVKRVRILFERYKNQKVLATN
ncbi:MAG: lytic transglycosylase domain-containing protein [Moraxellaceae bacterium]|nr:MAG: lytic transglycosylase domain-containing protein [Moraxellaceae bacterium]